MAETPNPTPAATGAAAAPAAAKPGEAAAPAAKPQTYELEIDGKKVALTAEQIKSLHGKANQFDLTAKQKAELEKETSRLMSLLDSDPFAVLQARGKVDMKKLVTEHFRKIVEDEAKDPAARKMAELEKFKADQEAKEKAQKDTEEKAKRDAEKKTIYVRTLREIDAALTAESLPKDYTTVDRMLRVMRSGKTVRGQAFTAAEAAKIVAREETKHLGYFIKQLPSQRLKEIFGADFIKKLNSEQVAELKKADEKAIQTNAVAAANGADPNDRKKSTLSAEQRKAIRNAMPGA